MVPATANDRKRGWESRGNKGMLSKKESKLLKKNHDLTHNWLSSGMVGSIRSPREELQWSSEVILVLTRQPLECRCSGRVFPSLVGDIRDFSTPSNWTVIRENTAENISFWKDRFDGWKWLVIKTNTCKHHLATLQIKVTWKNKLCLQVTTSTVSHVSIELDYCKVWEPKSTLCFYQLSHTQSHSV